LSYGSSAADINVITNPNSDIAEEDENISNYSEQFQRFLQIRRHQARKRQQQMFGMSSLISHPQKGQGKGLHGGASQGRHYAGRHRKLPTPPPGHPAFGRVPFLQYSSRESSLHRGQYEREELLNGSNSFRRSNRNQIEVTSRNDYTEPQSRRSVPPRRGDIIEEENDNWEDVGRNDLVNRSRRSNNRNRMLNSPQQGRKLNFQENVLSDRSYMAEDAEDRSEYYSQTNEQQEISTYDRNSMKGAESFDRNCRVDSLEKNHQPGTRRKSNEHVDTGTYTKKSHFDVDHNISSHGDDYLDQQQLNNFQNEPPPYPLDE
jgi:hypothetical protein